MALKVLKPGLDSEEVIRRFRAERQILAALDHPNIARLLDGGTTEQGLPYFAMEYVEGQPIDAYCAERQLSPGRAAGAVPHRLLRRWSTPTAIWWSTATSSRATSW